MKSLAAFLNARALRAALGKLPVWAQLALLAGVLLAFGLGARLANAPSRAATLDPIAIGADVLLKLSLVLGLIYGSVWVLRRWPALTGRKAERQMQVLETVRLSPRQALHLVQVGGQTFLVGATDHGITSLAEVEAPLPSEAPIPFDQCLAQIRHSENAP